MNLKYFLMPTPAEIAEKFAREWLEAKPAAIANYVAVSGSLAQLALDKQAEMISNWTEAVTGSNSKWVKGLQKYVGNGLMGQAYGEKLNDITTFTAAEKLKIQNSVELKRHLETQLDDVLALFKAATAGNVTVPPNLTDVALNQMLMSGIIAFETSFTTASLASAIYPIVADYMKDHYGWPEKA